MWTSGAFWDYVHKNWLTQRAFNEPWVTAIVQNYKKLNFDKNINFDYFNLTMNTMTVLTDP